MFKPYVGQKVKLNSDGFKKLKLNSENEYRQALNMTITSVVDINAGTDWESIWIIEVDQPAIRRYMLDSSLVTPI